MRIVDFAQRMSLPRLCRLYAKKWEQYSIQETLQVQQATITFLMNQIVPLTFEGPEFDKIGFFLQGYLKDHRVTVTKLHGPFQVGESQIQPRLLSTDRQAGAQKL